MFFVLIEWQGVLTQIISEALIGITLKNATKPVPSFFITVGNKKCFKTFASNFFGGLGNVGIVFALDEIWYGNIQQYSFVSV